jgi:hypothetical protein
VVAALVVKVTVRSVQSFVPVRVLLTLNTLPVYVEFHSQAVRNTEAAATQVVFAQQVTLYFVLALSG